MLTNKNLYNVLCLRKRSESIGINTWMRHLSLKEKPCLSNLYSFIFRFLNENKLKEFRWKLLQFIVPTKILLKKWKIAENNLCNFCNVEEDYYHYFIACDYLSNFWQNITRLLLKANIATSVTLKDIVFGYKIFDEEYFYFNYFLTILSFSVYKAYYVSEQKTKEIDVYKLFTKEFQKRMFDAKCLQNNTLLERIRKNL